MCVSTSLCGCVRECIRTLIAVINGALAGAAISEPSWKLKLAAYAADSLMEIFGVVPPTTTSLTAHKTAESNRISTAIEQILCVAQ